MRSVISNNLLKHKHKEQSFRMSAENYLIFPRSWDSLTSFPSWLGSVPNQNLWYWVYQYHVTTSWQLPDWHSSYFSTVTNFDNRKRRKDVLGGKFIQKRKGKWTHSLIKRLRYACFITKTCMPTSCNTKDRLRISVFVSVSGRNQNIFKGLRQYINLCTSSMQTWNFTNRMWLR